MRSLGVPEGQRKRPVEDRDPRLEKSKLPSWPSTVEALSTGLILRQRPRNEATNWTILRDAAPGAAPQEEARRVWRHSEAPSLEAVRRKIDNFLPSRLGPGIVFQKGR